MASVKRCGAEGGTARMAAMDPPQKVVNATIWSSLHPKKELVVGWKAKGAKFSHQVLPHFSERRSANIVHRYQIETAPTGANHNRCHIQTGGSRPRCGRRGEGKHETGKTRTKNKNNSAK